MTKKIEKLRERDFTDVSTRCGEMRMMRIKDAVHIY